MHSAKRCAHIGPNCQCLKISVYKAKYADKNGEYLLNEKGYIKNMEKGDEAGNWNVYKNGQLIPTYKGD